MNKSNLPNETNNRDLRFRMFIINNMFIFKTSYTVVDEFVLHVSFVYILDLSIAINNVHI